VNLAELTQLALLGTERQALKPFAGEASLARIQRQLDASQREQTLLSAAALAVTHERAGRLAARVSAPVSPSCPVETHSVMPSRAGALLLRLLGGELVTLLPESLALAARRQWLAPREALPALLAEGTRTAGRRGAILPLLGERGRWLAAQNPDWSWVGGAVVDEGVWQTGDKSARQTFLRQLRRTNPTRARELLVSTWAEEPPEERPMFVATLGEQLSAADEPFLDAALDDRRKEVRETAARLLARIPTSAFVRRMVERANLLLKFTPGEAGSLLKLKKAKPPALEVTLPTACDKAMQRDGVVAKPARGMGEKAWWLRQLVAAIPVAHWETQWQASAADIVQAAAATEFSEALLDGFMLAAVDHHAASWAGALLRWQLANAKLHKDTSTLLLGVLPYAEQAALLTEVLADPKLDARVAFDLFDAGTSCERGWDAALSRTILRWLRALVAQPSTDWQMRMELAALPLMMAPEVLPEAATGWPTDGAAWEFWSKGVDELIATAQFRTQLHEAFSTQP
jgi:hypothetical protein